jgi:hypothetical protein
MDAINMSHRREKADRLFLVQKDNIIIRREILA